jgi:hypothetical protein
MLNNIIFLNPKTSSKTFTSFNFYNEFLFDLAEYYKNTSNQNLPPSISFESIDFIDPIVLPNIISIGLYLKNYHKTQIDLILNYNPKLLYFLEHTGFFKIVGKESKNPNISPKGLDIFNFKEEFIGGFEILKQDSKKEHKIHYYYPNINYKSFKTEKELTDCRDSEIENLGYIIPNDFEDILANEFNLSIKGQIEYLNTFNEIISNSILHSNSITFAFMQTVKYKTAFAISDIGIGFEQSIKEKNDFEFKNIEKYTITNYFKKLKGKKFNQTLSDYYIIFDILFFSMSKFRLGLYDLIKPVIKAGGIFRIHYKSTQVIFTSNYINNFEKLDKIRYELRNVLDDNKNDIIEKSVTVINKSKEKLISDTKDNLILLSNIILRNYNPDLQVSPLRIFDVNFKGVHIEVEFK